MDTWVRVDALNGFVVAAIGLFFALTLVYSAGFMKGKQKNGQYYIYVILTAAASVLAVVSNNLLLLLVCWGFLGFTLYLLINMGDVDTGQTAKKTLIIVGGSDALMLFGIGLIYKITGSFQMDKINIPLTHHYLSLATIAYLCLAIACFAKAGAVPFHSWIPDCAKKAPIPVTAFLPASLDKLLGVYLLARISLNLFAMNGAMNILLMLIGAFTIISAVMMALIQHNMKKLLGYHAVSQVGYMVLGIGTGNPIGIAGGLFHMLNHAVYKTCLFFTAGNVEYRAHTAELDKLGGLAGLMPLTYIAAVIASLSISGVPPFNGFVSKWMVYQGLVQKVTMTPGHQVTSVVAVLCLAAALFGSALTLASFMKLIHAAFLGQAVSSQPKSGSLEVPAVMWFPAVLLAAVCVLFGVFAQAIPLKYFIMPAIPGVNFSGQWYATLSTALVIIGLILGALLFKLKAVKPVFRRDASYTGSETAALQYNETNRVTGTEFYNTIKEYGILKGIYKRAEAGFFDIYEQGKAFVFGIGRFFQYLHNGVLPTYLVWTLLGMIVLFFTLVK
ncbi:MAG: proton-conducting transporter membrane subunit [Candidatus Omnitrophica bacterium]|nr:proton-conducting transporter membrane subunit [Candidatus Omnitrophota bacterium]